MFAGQTGAIEIRGRISGATGESVNIVNFPNTKSDGAVGYGVRGDGHHVQFVAVAGNTSGEGYGAFIGVTGTVQGVENGVLVGITGAVDLRNAMAQNRSVESGRTGAMGILVQGVEAGLTATVAGEVYPGYGFGVPVAITGGRRLGIADVVTVTGSVQADGGRTII